MPCFYIIPIPKANHKNPCFGKRIPNGFFNAAEIRCRCAGPCLEKNDWEGGGGANTDRVAERRGVGCGRGMCLLLRGARSYISQSEWEAKKRSINNLHL